MKGCGRMVLRFAVAFFCDELRHESFRGWCGADADFVDKKDRQNH